MTMGVLEKFFELVNQNANAVVRACVQKSGQFCRSTSAVIKYSPVFNDVLFPLVFLGKLCQRLGQIP
ncbi:hypothetical protein D3C71_1871640 [compost metagenome]